MLPSFILYYLDSRKQGYQEEPLHKRVSEGLVLGLLVTAGFLLVFGTAGVVISTDLRRLVQYMPLAAVLVGVGLVLLGVWLLQGIPCRL